MDDFIKQHAINVNNALMQAKLLFRCNSDFINHVIHVINTFDMFDAI